MTNPRISRDRPPTKPRRRGRERKRTPVERNRLRTRERARIEAEQTIEEGERGGHPKYAASNGEQHALGEHVRDEPSAARTERETHGKLAPPAFAARQQQACEVRADHEQHEADGTKQHRELGPNVADDLVEVGPQEHEVAAVVVVGISPVGRQRTSLGFGLGEGATGREPPDGGPVVAPALAPLRVRGIDDRVAP
jgi:hypothetical protein